MNYEIIATRQFRSEAKRLSKKFPSLKDDLANLFEKLQVNPRTGAPLGNKTYKIRLAVKSKGTGRRGGLRVINHVLIQKTAEGKIYLLSIYDKSNTASLSMKKIRELVKIVYREMNL